MLAKDSLQFSAERLVKLLSVILLFSVMNATMFNIALPDIAAEFNLLPSEVGWVVTGYMIIYALGSLIYGKLADLYSLKRLMTIGLVLFSVGSLVGLLAQNYGMLLTGRFIQSAGASSIPALAMLIPVRYYEPDKRGRIMGIIASTIAFASGIGPIVGGFITGVFHWRYLFLISIITVLTIPYFRKWLLVEEVHKGKIDILGGVLFGGAITTLLLTITNYSWWLLLSCIVLFVCFCVRIFKADVPFIQPAIFRNRAFRNALISGFFGTGAVFGLIFMTPLMLKEINLLNTGIIGLIMFPGALSAAIMGRYGGKLADRKGSTYVIYIAMGMLIIGCLLLSTFSGYAPWIIALCLIIGNVGFSFMQASLANLISTTLAKNQTGVGIGMFTLVMFLSGAIGGPC